MGIFDNLLTNEFKSYFNDSIDYLLSDTGLTRSCLLVYSDRLILQAPNHLIILFVQYVMGMDFRLKTMKKQSL